jgi:hypothetical protein
MPGREADNLFQHTRHRLLPATVLAVAATLWVHGVLHAGGSLVSHAPYLAIDVLLAIPVAGVAVFAAGALARRGLAGTGMAMRAGAMALAFMALFAPLAMLQAYSHQFLGLSGSGATAHGHTATDLAGIAGYGVTTALQVWPAVLLAAVLGVLGQEALGDRRSRLRLWVRIRSLPRPAAVVSSTMALVAGVGMFAILPASPASAQTPPGSCGSAPQRVYDVHAIDVEITIDRHGDSDPFGYMYVLEDNIGEVRDFEAKLRNASATTDRLEPDGTITPWAEVVAEQIEAAEAAGVEPDVALVSNGLQDDPIQPLVLRARLGECVVINLTNDITRAPVGGPARRLFEFPGGVPSISIDMQGVSYDAAFGDGGQEFGNNPAGIMTDPGETEQYRFFLDPVMDEGTKVFRSGGESSELTAHGLFGALVAEPTGAHWFDPMTGEDKTNDPSWANWEAMIAAPGEITFREFAILYHEIGDEDFTLRRPLRENFGGAGSPLVDPFDTSPTPRLIGGSMPMVDRRAPDLNRAFFRGAGTTAYRPGGKGLNYRSETFFRRLQHESELVFRAGGTSAQAAQEQLENKSLGYSSYTYGDPATPIPRSYLGEPTKTRLAHVGFAQLHVHHLHGGGDRWRQNPNADDTAIDSGLDKNPDTGTSIRVDSQTISPEESFSLEHECGAGGCQQAAGDFLYHCHIAHHYIAGMWGFWRVFDTAQVDLAPLPGAVKPLTAVNSAALLGTTLSNGKTVVLDSQVTDPDTQVGLETLVESQVPAQGVRLDKHDATVWDWVKSGPDTAPVYMGEPDYGDVSAGELRAWGNYRSATPGQRHPILFNSTNGRPAFPLLQPHVTLRPPFSGNEHSGAPWLGEDGSDDRPDGLCPEGAPLRTYDITAVSVDIQMTDRELDPGGMLFVLNEDKEDLLSGARPPEPLAIRSNVGDCVAVTLANQIDNPERLANGLKQLAKTNMHTHFVQFDPLASDGVITGLSYEQSMYASQLEARELVSVDGPDTITVNHVNRLREGIAIGIGVGTPNIEIRTIVDITGNTLTFDRPLEKSHDAGEPVSVEFVQYRWFSDVDSGTVFWHDHTDGIISWAHGLFGAHIIEPAGSTYHDPVTGEEVRSGAIVDIHNDSPGASAGVGSSGDFREFMIWLHNGRSANQGPSNFIFGQECEESSINLRAAPFGERTPPGTLIGTEPNPINVDPTTTDQRFQFNGSFECRNSYDRTGAPRTNDRTAQATVTTVDPYVFSSVKYGDPLTPLLRAYTGDDVVIRTIGLDERGEALRMAGHQFRMERFNADGQLMDTAVTGISERFDYVLDGGAGGPAGMSGDFLYYSTRTFALESGGWGIFRVHDAAEGDLQPLPDNAPPSGEGFPILEPNTADNPQATPGPNPPAPSASTVSNDADPCPRLTPTRIYSVTVFDHALPTSPFVDTEGIVYSLTSDEAAIRSGAKAVEPLVLRVNQGECLIIRLRNRIDPDSLYGGTRAGFDLGQLLRNPQTSGGAAIGLNPDTTVVSGDVGDYRFFADREVGTTIFQNLGSPASLRHGAYGLLIVEPAGSQWFDSVTGAQLGGTLTSTEAIIDPPAGRSFREFALTLQSTDEHFSRSVIPYMHTIAGSGINPQRNAGGQPPLRPAPVVGAPPGTENNPGSFDKGYNHVNYRSEPLTARIGLTAAPGHIDQDGDGVIDPGWFGPGFQLAAPHGTAFSSNVHGDPATPVFRAHSGDAVVFRVGIGASDQLHAFTISGHMFPLEPGMWSDDSGDRRSQLMTTRTITAGQTLDAELVGGAGGPIGFKGDFAFRDGRQNFTAAGMWGIFRVLPGSGPGSGQIEAIP